MEYIFGGMFHFYDLIYENCVRLKCFITTKLHTMQRPIKSNTIFHTSEKKYIHTFKHCSSQKIRKNYRMPYEQWFTYMVLK